MTFIDYLFGKWFGNDGKFLTHLSIYTYIGPGTNELRIYADKTSCIRTKRETFYRYNWEMSENISDHELLTILQTDPDNAEMALTEIYSRYFTLLCVLVFRLVGSAEDARDIVSEVFVQLWAKKDTNGFNIADLKPYLIVSAYNNGLNWKRRSSRRLKRDKEWTEQNLLSPSSPDNTVIEAEYYQSLYKALEGLTPRTREVFLEYLKGNGTEEISKRLGLDKQTVLNHKTLARQKLISILNNTPHLVFLLALAELF